MKKGPNLSLWTLCLALLSTAVLAADTAPTTRASFPPGSPKAAMQKFNDVLPAGGLTVARAAYNAETDDDRHAADAMAKCDLATSQVQAAVIERFGPAAEDKFLRASRNATDKDLEQADEKDEVDKATLTFKHKLGTVVMVRKNGAWLSDVAQSLAANKVSVEDVLGQCEVVQKMMEAVNKELKDGEFPNLELLLRDVKQRMFRIAGEDTEADRE